MGIIYLQGEFPTLFQGESAATVLTVATVKATRDTLQVAGSVTIDEASDFTAGRPPASFESAASVVTTATVTMGSDTLELSAAPVIKGASSASYTTV